MRAPLIGREAENAVLARHLDGARRGEGSLLLLSGEAGVGKTRLLAELAAASGIPSLRGAAVQGSTTPYGPLAAVLRCHLQLRPGGLDGCGRLRAQLALLLPELGDPAARADRATLHEALRCAFTAVAAARPAIIVLDDLHWSDEATLEVLAALAEPVRELRLLVIAAYRSDGLPRDHGIRRLRHELRRAGLLSEVALAPLSLDETAVLLAHALGRRPAHALVRAIHERTEGVPFFVEELAASMRVSGGLTNGVGDVPLPETVRDAVLVRARELSAAGRAAAEVAAVAGEAFDLELVARLADEAGLSELIELGIVLERGERGRFRHALTREALYADVPWARRRALHRELGAALERAGAPGRELATHWLGARADERAREALLGAAAESEALHAYRDAAEAGRLALELWPDGEDEARRAGALEQYARCCQLCGELAEAAVAWRELIALHDAAARERDVADAERGLAAVHDLRGDREAAVAARRSAADRYAATGFPAEAAVERLAAANQRRLAARHGEAIALAVAARADAERAGRLDLRIRALGLEGLARAKHGEYEEGLDVVRAGLALALEHDLTSVAAELYQRLSVTIYDSGDYVRAQAALDTALGLCRNTPDAATELACVSCMAFVLRERGEWEAAAAMCREMIAGGDAVFVAEALLGSIYVFEGRTGPARRLLNSALATASRVSHYNMTVDATWALARLAVAENEAERAAEHCRSALARWKDSDDHHYALGGLRWASGFYASRGDRAGAHAAAEALTRIASRTGHADALAALAAAIAETALLEGDAETAAGQLTRAVELHRDLDLPFERAQIELRAGVALAACGERDAALEHLTAAYRTARKLGARPLAADVAREVTALGEPVEVRLGRRAVAAADATGLSQREREVMRHVARGATNREIAEALVVSTRTVDMHVRNILRKLDCRSRVEAAGRAREFGLA